MLLVRATERGTTQTELARAIVSECGVLDLFLISLFVIEVFWKEARYKVIAL